MKLYFSLFIAFFTLLSVSPARASRITNAAFAVNAPKDRYKAMLNIFAYDTEGKLLRSGTAFFIDEQGNAAAPYSILVGASRAEVVDYKGNKYAVNRILGANSTYDLVRFSTIGTKKNAYLPITSSGATKGSTLYMLRYTNQKKQEPQAVSIINDEAYNDYRYYTVSIANETSNFACPLTDENGNLVALVQKNVSKDAANACAIDARFIPTLSISAMSVFNADLRALNIQKALPGNAKDALSYLYMMPQSDSTMFCTAYNDFISTYPDAPEGYIGLAGFYASSRNYGEAEKLYTTALEKSLAPSRPDSLMHPDAVHYQLSRQIYQAALQQPDSVPVYTGWTFDRALTEAQTAYGIEPYTLYLVQQGNCLFALRKYNEAYNLFIKATTDKAYATAETYFTAARSLELAGGDTTQVMALMDSTIAHISQPASARDAQYYLQRSQRYLSMGKYREAVFDYNEYEKAIGPRNLTDRFYYLRHEAEVEAHMYQQALDDLHTAISYSSAPIPYRIDEAYLLLRVGEFQQAIDAAKAVLSDLPENPDCYKIIGIAYGELGKKQLAQQHLQKALSLGDESVKSAIEKYK